MKLKTGFKYIGMVAMVALLSGCSGDNSTEDQIKSGVITENMDTSVKPGDDFFAYVNGTWIKNYVIADDKAGYGTFSMLQEKSKLAVKAIIEESAQGNNALGSNEQKVGDMFNSFMDMDKRNEIGTAPMMKIFDEIDVLSDHRELGAYFAQSIRSGFGAPFGLFIYGDADDPTLYVVHSGQSGIGFRDRSYYIKTDAKSVEIRDKYLIHIEKMFTLMGMENPGEIATMIMALETKLATAMWTKEDSRDSIKTNNIMDRTALAELMPDFDWVGYFDILGTPNLDKMNIFQPSYFKALNGIMGETDIVTWKLYFKWRSLSIMADYMNEAIVNQNFDFYYKTMRGVKKQQDQWKRGVDTVNRTLGEVVGQVYVAQHFKPEAKARMLELVENLSKAYENSIKDLDWMGEETKTKALDKLHKFNPKIGYPDKWKDYSALEIKEDDLFGNIMRSTKVDYDLNLAKLDGPVKRNIWALPPQIVAAYSNSTLNEITFHAAILQPPFFEMGIDDAVNYGAIGAVIGHEIGHGFDDQGSSYDADGALKNWWTDEDKEEFKKRTGALVDQYNGFQIFDDLNVNGKFTLGENIGDLGGVSIAIKAYHLSLNGKPAPVIDGLTAEQRIFIGWGQVFMGTRREASARQQAATDPHSPAQFRVNGVVRNIPAFYEAFNVQPGDKLYLAPVERVKIW